MYVHVGKFPGSILVKHAILIVTMHVQLFTKCQEIVGGDK